MRLKALLLTSITLVTACADEPTEVELKADMAQGTRLFTDDVVGVSVPIPAGWAVNPDAVLFDRGYGFLISGEDRDLSASGPHDREPIARVARVHNARPHQLEELVRAQFDAHQAIPSLQLSRAEVEVGNGLKGVAVTGLPGTQPYSAVYVASGEHVYEIGLWTNEPGLDARAHALLGSLRFTPPTRSVESLGLKAEKESLYWEPTGALALRSKAALAERTALAMEDDWLCRQLGWRRRLRLGSAPPLPRHQERDLQQLRHAHWRSHRPAPRVPLLLLHGLGRENIGRPQVVHELLPRPLDAGLTCSRLRCASRAFRAARTPHAVAQLVP